MTIEFSKARESTEPADLARYRIRRTQTTIRLVGLWLGACAVLIVAMVTHASGAMLGGVIVLAAVVSGLTIGSE